MSVIFISHSSRDAEAAASLAARLEAIGHRSLFLDFDPEKGIVAGASWERTLYAKLRACRAVIALCTEHYVTSQWCFAEVALARMEGKEIFALQCAPWGDEAKIPSLLAERQLIDMRSDEDEAFARLRRGLKEHGIAPSDQRAWKPDDPPYPGLMAYHEEDAAIFFGRAEETRKGVELLARMRRQGYPRLALVLGGSGTGKSSLLRAGMVPKLRRGPDRWLVIDAFRPGHAPTDQLATVLSRAFGEAGEPLGRKEIARQLRASGARPLQPSDVPAPDEAARSMLLEALAAFETDLSADDDELIAALRRFRHTLARAAPASGQPSPTPAAAPPRTGPGGRLARLVDSLLLAASQPEASVLLVIDQLEELLGPHDEDGTAPAFIALLRDTLTLHERFFVIATLRSDFLESFQRNVSAAGVEFDSLPVSTLAQEHIRQVIEEPARLASLALEPALVERLLADTGTPDALPLLAFTLRTLWDRHHQDGTLTLDQYTGLGGIQGAVAQVADEAYEGALRLGREDDLRKAFLAMARPVAGGHGWTRQPLEWKRLQQPDRLLPLLRHFENHRLLVSRDDGFLEVAHEAMFRSWDRLRRWLDQSAEALKLLSEIRVDGERWQRADQADKRAYLLRGWRLARALDLEASGDLLLQANELALLRRSEHEDRRERRRKKRRRRAVMAGLTLLAAIFAWLAISASRARHEAEEQLARAMAVSARSGGYRLDQALLMAVEASYHPSFESRTSLFHLLEADPRLIAFLHGHEGIVWSLAFAPDGSLVSGSGDSTLRRWDVGKGIELARQPVDDQVVRVDIVDDGTIWGIGDHQGTAVVWGPAGATPHRAGVIHRSVRSGAVSRDGSLRAVGTYAGTICVDGLGAASACVTAAHGTATRGSVVHQLAFGPDDRLVSAGGDGAVRQWRVSAQGLTLVWQALGHAGGATAVRVADPVGAAPAWILSGSAAGEIATIDWSSGRRRAWESTHGDAIVSLAASTAEAKAPMVASGSADGAMRVWRLAADGSPVLWIEAEDLRTGVYSLAFDADGTVLAAGTRDGVIRLWNLAESPPTAYELVGQAAETRGFAFSPAGDVALTGDLDGHARAWSLTTDRAIRATAALAVGGEVNNVVLSDRGNAVVAGSGDAGRVVHWHLPSDEQHASTHEGSWTTSLALRADGSVLAAGIGGRLHLTSLTATQPADPLPSPERVRTVALDPSGRLLATGHDDGRVFLWQVASAGVATDPVQAPASGDGDPPSRVLALAFDPVGRYLAASAANFTIKVWDTASHAEVATLAGHGGTIRHLQFNPAGDRLVSTSDDATLRVWAMPSGEALMALIGHKNIVHHAAFTAEGSTLLSGSADRTIRRWPIARIEDLAAARRDACAVANRGLTDDEQADLSSMHRRLWDQVFRRRAVLPCRP